ncbi:hypothetical protein l13_12260 [Neisseria weaveri ATCC 51223]|nr:hypothetical protein l13_12260 [Neisseria weaveri ATCC 51223]
MAARGRLKNIGYYISKCITYLYGGRYFISWNAKVKIGINLLQ